MPVFETQIVVSNYLDVSSTEPSNPVHGQKWMDGTIMKTWDDTLKEWVLEDLKGESSSLWIRYADDDKGNGFSASPANKKFVAMKTAINNPVPSDDPADYEGLWAKFMGPEGESIEGPPGKDGQPTYTWIRYADNVSGGGISANPEGKMYIGFAYNKPTPTPSNIPKDYAWSAMYDEAKMLELQEQVNGINYVGTNLWAPNFYEGKGNIGAIDITTGIANSNANYLYTDYIPLSDNKTVTRSVFEVPSLTALRISFYSAKNTESFIETISANATSTGAIVVNVPKSANYMRFFVNRTSGKIKVELGNKATDYSISPLDTPTTGDLSNVQTELQQQLNTIVMPVTQPNTPENPKEGMIWWQNNLAGQIIGCSKYEKGKWEPQTIQQSMLNIIELNAIRITGSTITGTEISGSTIISAFDNTVVQGSPIRQRGTLTLDKGYALIKYEQYNENTPNVVINKGETRMDEYGISTVLKDKNDNVLVSSQYGPLGININDRSKSYGSVNLGYSDLLTIPETALTASNDWAIYANSGANKPTAKRKLGTVTLGGAFTPTKNLTVTGVAESYIMGVLPPGLRPVDNTPIVAFGSGLRKYRLMILTNGQIQADRNADNTGYVDFNVGGWYSINTNFPAASV